MVTIDVVAAHGAVVQRLAVHVDDEAVTDGGHRARRSFP